MELPFRIKSKGDAGEETPEILPEEFSRQVMQSRTDAENMISTAEHDLRRLNEVQWSLKYTSIILAAAILLNLWGMITFTWKFYLYWIMSSFIFLMINPFILMLPTDIDDIKSLIRYLGDLKNRERKSRDEITSRIRDGSTAESMEKLKRLSRQKSYLIEFGWNLFFVNCQPLAPGFLILFLLSSVFAFAGWAVNGEFELLSSMIVIVQSVAIIVFYTAIVYVQPYSRGFFMGMLGMGSRFKKRYKEAWTQGLKFALTAAILITGTGVIFLAAIMLPGFTYNKFIAAEADIEIQAGTFVLVFIMQMIFVRHLQGKYSRALVHSILTSRIEMIREEILPGIAKLGSVPLRDGVTPQMREELNRIRADIIRHQLVKIDFRSLFGYFPVCMINPDVNTIMSVSDKWEKGSMKGTAGVPTD